MALRNNNHNNEKEILTIFSFRCELCHQAIEVPLTKRDKESQVGGIFQKILFHQCQEKPIAFFMYFDEHFTLRQKIIKEVSIAGISESNGFSPNQIESIKFKYGFNYFYKKFADNFAQIIYAILIGQQIIVLGEKTLVTSLIHMLRVFAQIRNCKINDWRTSIDRSADIIGTPNVKTIEEYPLALIIDLEKNRLYHGTQNAYALKLLQTIKEQPDSMSLIKEITKELRTLDKQIALFLRVTSFDEVELFLEALALEKTDESFLEIIVAIGAQLNPFIAQYYRFYSDTKETRDLNPMSPPFKLWLIDRQGINTEIIFQADRLTNFKEFLIIEHVQALLHDCQQPLELYEYFTPLNHYLLIPRAHTTNVLFKFPRFNEDITIITNVMKYQFSFLNQMTSKQASAIIKEKLKESMSNIWQTTAQNQQLPEKCQHLLEIRKELPLLLEHSILESLFFELPVNTKSFRRLTSSLVDLLCQKFACEPKIYHKRHLYTITATIPKQVPDNPTRHQEIDVHFNIHFYLHEPEKNNKGTVVLDLYIDPKQMTLGLECHQLFKQLFMKFQQLFRLAFKE